MGDHPITSRLRPCAAADGEWLAYTGDDIYERVGGYGIERESVETAILDYLRKLYLFAGNRDLLKDIPAVGLPDPRQPVGRRRARKYERSYGERKAARK